MSSHIETQKKLIETYMELLKKKTIREMSKDTGIQVTRFFRLMNGSEMKLSEYLTIKERVEALSHSNLELIESAKSCENSLSTLGVRKMDSQMRRRVRLSQIIKKAS